MSEFFLDDLNKSSGKQNHTVLRDNPDFQDGADISPEFPDYPKSELLRFSGLFESKADCPDILNSPGFRDGPNTIHIGLSERKRWSK